MPVLERLMIFNWKWEETSLPKFYFKRPQDSADLSKEIVQQSFHEQWESCLGLWRKEAKVGKSESWKEVFKRCADPVGNPKEENQSENIILKVTLDIQEMDDPAVRSETLKTFLTFFKDEWVAKKKPSPNSPQILAFFHEKHGFQKQAVSPLDSLDPNTRYFPFAGGYGVLYSKRGLLNVDRGIYRRAFEEKEEPITQDESGNFLYIKAKPFNYIWDHYWYGTARRIKEIRQLYHTSLIPGMDLEQQIKLVFQHLLDSLAGKPSELNSDLTECDLSKVPEFQNPTYRKLNFQLDEEALKRDITAVLENTKQGKGLYSEALIKTLDQVVANLNA